jgi:glycosyltransferase involved in cell wall biosynthesis
MKVLLINVGYRGGGAERCSRELFHLLPSIGIETELWVSHLEQQAPLGVHGMRYRWEDALNFLEAVPFWSDWRHRGSIRKLDAIRPDDFDLVHLHNLHTGCASIKAMQRLCARMPVVWTLHDEWAVTGGNCYYLRDRVEPKQIKDLTWGLLRHVPYHPYHDNVRYLALKRFLSKWMPQPRAIICPSHYLFEAARSCGRFTDDSVYHIPYGLSLLDEVETQCDRKKARLSWGLDPEYITVLLLAADVTDPRKGMKLAAQAIRDVGQHLRLQVLLLGKSTNNLLPMLNGCRVISGYADNNQALARAYRAADMTVIPSIADNLPYVGLESLACGTPLAAFSVGGLPDLIGNNERGMIAEPLTSAALAETIRQLCIDRDRWLKKGLELREWVRQTCAMPQFLNAMVEVFRRSAALKSGEAK